MSTNSVQASSLQAPAAINGATGLLPLAGRIGLAAIFVLSGVSKLPAPEATLGYRTRAVAGLLAL
jgi:putative oxidoreductase